MGLGLVRRVISSINGTTLPVFFGLLESGSFLLLETGDKIIL